MRSVAEYLAKAAEFDDLTRSISEQTLKTRYSDIAECYRLLAHDRQRFLEPGVIDSAK
jgi:hypothetical protein